MIKLTNTVEDMQILSNKEIAKDIYEMVLSGEIVSMIKSSGQFLHLKMPSEHMILRRPISIAAYDENTATLLYRIVGQGTAEMASLKANDSINVLGPLGRGFDISLLKKQETVLIVGGGIGIAPLYQLAKDLHKQGHKIISVLGFANKDDIYYQAQFEELGLVIITTDDGSYGIKGHVGQALENVQAEAVYACGPTPLLKLVQGEFKDLEHVYISLEEKMACGIGACYACDTKLKDKRVCTDGPVFHRSEVDL